MDQRVAVRYAQALMDVANDLSMVDRMSDDMDQIEQTIETAKDLRAMLHSPVIRPGIKHTVLNQIFASHVSKETMQFVDLIVKKGRGDLLHSVVAEFRKLVDTKRNVMRAQIRSAVELSKPQQDAIGKRLASITGKTIVASYVLDPSLKAGFVARIGDTLIDASLSHQLEILREQFKKGTSPLRN